MAIRVDYVARETGQNLVRNGLLTLATILTVAVSLSMLTVTLLLRTGVETAFEKWNGDVSFIVYLNVGADKAVIDKIGRELRSNPQVDTVEYVDDKATFDLFKKLFADDPTLLGTVKEGQLPTSFRVKPKNPNAEAVKALGEEFRSKPGVYQVDFPEETVKAIQRTADKLITAALGGSIALLVATILMIFVAIQTAVFARRREIEVMKLIGATNWFIRLPFVLEGVIQCVAGALLAGMASFGFTAWWLSSQNTPLKYQNLLERIRWDYADMWSTSLLALGIGVLVGAVASTVSVTWYLRV